MQVRDLIDDARALARVESDRRPTFVAGDLRQCLSSYEQLRESALLTTKGLPGAGAVVQTLDSLASAGHQHPKVRAICDVVEALVGAEIDRVRGKLGEMPGKILVFNTLMRTARALSVALNDAVKRRIDPFLDESFTAVGWAGMDDAKDVVSQALGSELPVIRGQIEKDRGARFLEVDRSLIHAAGMEMKEERGNIVDVMFNRVTRHCHQPLFLLRLARYLKSLGWQYGPEDVAHFLMNRVTERLRRALDRIVDDFLDDTPVGDDPAENRDRAIREIGRLGQILAAPASYVGRFDGETRESDRERTKENFNRPYAPLVLLASRVGEEGIDLQAHTRFVLHYDIEWNPAKMEQREGRVDREGRLAKDPVHVQFFLLKDTYEERVFHTVMQRHLWFEVLIGGKKKELAKAFDVDEAAIESGGDADYGNEELGCLTRQERDRVMLNLEPMITGSKVDHA
jgi:ERCC4-related helicase